MLELKGFFKLLNVVDVICQAVKFEIVEDTILWAYAKARDVSKKIVDAKTKGGTRPLTGLKRYFDQMLTKWRSLLVKPNQGKLSIIFRSL